MSLGGGVRRVLGASCLLLLAGCAGAGSPPDAEPDPQRPAASPSAPQSPGASPAETSAEAAEATEATEATEPAAADGAGAPRAVSRPLRRGERRVTVTMPEPYAPSAPTGVGTDDYRCFLLDPGLDEDAFITGTDVLPGNPDVVHHVILFRLPPAQVRAAEAMDSATRGPGWTCFGDAGIGGSRVDDAPWLGAWAPGATESVHPAGYGVSLTRGSTIVMQVHYNLLAGSEEDVSSTRLRVAPASTGLTPLRTMLLPAPVELPCRRGRTGHPLCDRSAAVADVKARFGQEAGSMADLLHLFCGSPPTPGPVQSCTRTLHRSATIRGVAGHMHLLGQSIRIDVDPGTRRARTVLDIPAWDFDDQTATPVDPVRLRAGDRVRVTCRHSQRLRDVLPAFDGQPDRYVVWGEGTTDEMCLGILQVTRP